MGSERFAVAAVCMAAATAGVAACSSTSSFGGSGGVISGGSGPVGFDGSVPPGFGIDAGGFEGGVSLEGAAPGVGCDGRAAGLYCGSTLMLGTNDLYACDGKGTATVAESCSQGCDATLSACYHASCSAEKDGAYCGLDQVRGNPALLYECAAGSVASFQACPDACVVEPSGAGDRCGVAIPAQVRAAAGNGWALVRWSPASPVKAGFTIAVSPGGAILSVNASAASVEVPGLTNGVAYTFTVAQDGGTPSAETAPVVPSASANVIADVLHHPQTHNLTSEEAALVMALSHQGVTKTEEDVLTTIGVDSSAATFDANGYLHWGNPYKSFVGSPDGLEAKYTGYGAYWPALQQAAVSLGGSVAHAGESTTPAVLYAAILVEQPAVVWITANLQVEVKQNTWITTDGQTLGWYGPEKHAVTIVGVDDTTVIVDNPLDATEWQRIDKPTFEAAYGVYNQAAVVLN